MDIVKIEKKQTLSREEAAHQLRAIADELASGNGILMERDGLRVTVKLPDEVTMEVEVEIESEVVRRVIEDIVERIVEPGGRIAASERVKGRRLGGMRPGGFRGLKGGDLVEVEGVKRGHPPCCCERGSAIAIGDSQ